MNQVQFEAGPFVEALGQAILTTKDPSPHPAYPGVEVVVTTDVMTLRCLDGQAETTVSVPTQPTLLPWTAVVDARQLLDAVRSFQSAGHETTVAATLSTGSLSVCPVGSDEGHELSLVGVAMPTFEIDPGVEYRVIVEGDHLRLALTRALAATRQREIEQWKMFTTCGVFLQWDGENLTTTGTDLTQMMYAKVGGDLDFEGSLPKRKSGAIVTREFAEVAEKALRDNPGWRVSLAVTDRFVELKFGTIVIRSMLINGTYPPCLDIVPARQHVLSLQRGEFQAAVSQVTAVVEPMDDRSMTLSITPGKMVLSKRGKRSVKTLYGDWDCTRDGIHLDSQRLKAFLAKIPGESLEMSFGGDGRTLGQRNGLLFTDAGSDAYQFVLMPIDKSHRK